MSCNRQEVATHTLGPPVEFRIYLSTDTLQYIDDRKYILGSGVGLYKVLVDENTKYLYKLSTKALAVLAVVLSLNWGEAMRHDHGCGISVRIWYLPGTMTFWHAYYSQS